MQTSPFALFRYKQNLDRRATIRGDSPLFYFKVKHIQSLPLLYMKNLFHVYVMGKVSFCSQNDGRGNANSQNLLQTFYYAKQLFTKAKQRKNPCVPKNTREIFYLEPIKSNNQSEIKTEQQ